MGTHGSRAVGLVVAGLLVGAAASTLIGKTELVDTSDLGVGSFAGSRSIASGLQPTEVQWRVIDPDDFEFLRMTAEEVPLSIAYQGRLGDPIVAVQVGVYSIKNQAGTPVRADSTHYAHYVSRISAAAAEKGYRLHSVQILEEGHWEHILQWGSMAGRGAGAGWTVPHTYILLYEKTEADAWGR
ncbi:MAG: hypothetical protein ACF8SC_08455 [Phycisphaerales bacterium JB037]